MQIHHWNWPVDAGSEMHMLEFISMLRGEVVIAGQTLKLYFDANHQGLQAAVLAFFAFVNSVRIVAYVPQIVKASRDGNGASAISCLTWGLFLASHVATILYAVVCLGDLLMAAIFMGNAFACIVIVAVTLSRRRAHRLKHNPAE
ncbi:hypothetical protein [Tropicimonas aquimaris]|uniref:Uncharacterized protein n=1 Tax=Tropicimonas aquimaris TaxID=914152 RepID=A0ABW3IR52_9RHOB